MDQNAEPDTASVPVGKNRNHRRSIAMIAIFDVGGPLALYYVLRSQGISSVIALVLSGVFPAIGVAIGVVADRRIDALGVLVLSGILVGTALGLATHNARLVLIEGSVPTGVFGLACLGSLWTSRPLLYRFAIEFMGEDSPKGIAFADRWQYEGFRHVFRAMTVVWGVAYLIEAATRIVIVESTSTGEAFTLSKVTPYLFLVILAAWTVSYGVRSKRRAERQFGTEPELAKATGDEG